MQILASPLSMIYLCSYTNTAYKLTTYCVVLYKINLVKLRARSQVITDPYYSQFTSFINLLAVDASLASVFVLATKAPVVRSSIVAYLATNTRRALSSRVLLTQLRCQISINSP